VQGSPIQIGAISLHGFEVPQKLRFGGRYRVVVHTLAGGARVLEPIGPDDGDIQFEGTFSGPQAAARARAIDSLRLSGEIVWLTWESFRYQVIVKTFLADYHSPWWIPYKVSCLVASQPGATSTLSAALGILVTADLTNAVAAASGSSIQLASLQTALFTDNALTPGTVAQSQALAALASCQVAISSQITQQSEIVASPFNADVTISAYGPLLNNAVAAAGALAAAVNTGSYVGRIAQRIGSTGG
jgi:hypothetical protein